MRSVTRIVTITALVVAVAMVLRNVDLTGSDASDATGVIEATALDAASLASNDLPSNAGTTATELEDDSTRSSQIEVEDPQLAVVRDDHVAELEDDEPNPEPEPKPGVVPSEETHSNSNPAESESSSEVVQPVAVVRDDYVEEPEDEDDDDDHEPDPVESNNDESSSSNLTATLA